MQGFFLREDDKYLIRRTKLHFKELYDYKIYHLLDELER